MYWIRYMIDLFGVQVPLWAFIIIGIVIVVLAWKLIKFALTILIIIVIALLILMFVDFLGIFENFENVINNII